MSDLTKSPHEFGLEVTLLPGYPNVYQNPGGPIEVISFELILPCTAVKALVYQVLIIAH